MNEMIEYKKTDSILHDISCIVENAQRVAIDAVNVTLVLRNWSVGRRIAEEYMIGSRTERYGEGIITELADALTQRYGKGFDKRSLYRYVQFYQQYPEIVGSVSPQSNLADETKIVGSVSPQSEIIVNSNHRRLLSWSHYERLLQVPEQSARVWYEREAIEQSWSVRTLRRNINTQYYECKLLLE